MAISAPLLTRRFLPFLAKATFFIFDCILKYMKRIKLIFILSVLALVGIFMTNSHHFSTNAKGDRVLEEIAKYKSWTKVSKEPIKVAFSIDGADG